MSGAAARVLLVRHPEVARYWQHRCYGRSNVGLSRAGNRQGRDIAAKLARKPITSIVHSGLDRAALLAARLAELTGIPPNVDARWQERDFGSWEGRTWHAIWRETGNAMDGMLSSPHTFRPGGGETTAELAARSLAAWRALPKTGLVLVITHGGPIAAVRAMLADAEMADMARYRIAQGSVITLPRR